MAGDLFDPNQLGYEGLPDEAQAACNETSVPIGSESDNVERLKSALHFISADDRQTWIKFGIAIKHDLGEVGLAPWLEVARLV